MISKRSCITVVGTTLLVLTGVVLTYGTIPAPNGVIYGCYNKSGGTLRAIDNAVTKCASNETQLTWNQTGPQGTIGPAGPQGLPGTAGIQGLPGTAGIQGLPGAAGSQGPVGPAGPAGSAGSGGLSHVYMARVASANTSPTSTTVATLTIPSAGAYIIDAKAVFGLNFSGNIALGGSCQLLYFPPTALPGDSAATSLPPTASSENISSEVSLQDAQTFSVPTAIELACSSPGFFSVPVQNVVVRATLVGGVN
jgi:Collagen triple helix repeat (20 copies)